MFLLKLFGAVLIVLSGTMTGFFASRKYSGRVEDLHWYIGAVTSVMQKIRFGVPDIAAATSEVYQSAKYYSVERPFSVKLKKSFLSRSEEDTVNDFFSQLGSGDTQTELSRCAYCIAELELFLKAAQKKKEENGRLCKMLGFFTGIAVAIVLI